MQLLVHIISLLDEYKALSYTVLAVKSNFQEKTLEKYLYLPSVFLNHNINNTLLSALYI